MRGIADGAGCHLLEVVALNARTELLAGVPAGPHPAYEEAHARNRAAGVPALTECTTIAALPGATAGGATLLAQTWDWIGSQRDACVVLHIHEPDRPPIVTLTEAGIIAKLGINGAGVAVCLNILRSTSDGQRPGLPVHVLLRRALQTGSLSEARNLVEGTQAAASSCITIADDTGVAVSIELTPGGNSALEPRDGLLVHTNHCLAPTAQAGECVHDPASSTVPRYNRASELAWGQHGQIGSETLMHILRDREGAPLCICRRADPTLPAVQQRETVAGVVFDLRERVMHLAAGRPCDVEFVPVAVGASA
jgi:isopenicillin-N N-acyltransferase-like protein